MHGRGQFSKVFLIAGGDDLDMAIFSIADPPAKVKRGGLAMYEPAKSDALNAALDEVVVDHWFRVQCGRGWGGVQGRAEAESHVSAKRKTCIQRLA